MLIDAIKCSLKSPVCIKFKLFSSSDFHKMARGHQKIQSQQRNAKKQAEQKKAKGHDQKTAAKAALVFTCSVCKVSIWLRPKPDLATEMSCCMEKSRAMSL